MQAHNEIQLLSGVWPADPPVSGEDATFMDTACSYLGPFGRDHGVVHRDYSAVTFSNVRFPKKEHPTREHTDRTMGSTPLEFFLRGTRPQTQPPAT